MWVSKTQGGIKDFTIRKDDTMAGVLTFTQNGSPYSLANVTANFRIYIPGQETPVLTLTHGNGFTKGSNTISFDKLISLATGMYRYELYFDYSSGGTDAIMMAGAFWVRKNTTNDNSGTDLVIEENNVNVAVAVTVNPADSSGINTLWLDPTEGEYEVSHAALGGATEIVLLIREEGNYRETTGTPTGRQFKFTDNVTSGTLTFDTTKPFNAGEAIYVQYRKP